MSFDFSQGAGGFGGSGSTVLPSLKSPLGAIFLRDVISCPTASSAVRNFVCVREHVMEPPEADLAGIYMEEH